ncbi:hypothetical protein GIB67_004129, partial [Kingdonia uniflora]
MKGVLETETTTTNSNSKMSNLLSPFLSKTYDMVEDLSTDSIVSWSPSKNSFIVWDSSEFTRDLLPKYFKHNDFSSFVRQLNTYEPVLPGCFLRAKAIGLVPMIDQGEKDEKIITVCADDPEYRHYTDIKELSPHRLAEIRRFFEDYKKNENREVAVNDFLPSSDAYQAIQHS